MTVIDTHIDADKLSFWVSFSSVSGQFVSAQFHLALLVFFRSVLAKTIEAVGADHDTLDMVRVLPHSCCILWSFRLSVSVALSLSLLLCPCYSASVAHRVALYKIVFLQVCFCRWVGFMWGDTGEKLFSEKVQQLLDAAIVFGAERDMENMKRQSMGLPPI